MKRHVPLLIASLAGIGSTAAAQITHLSPGERDAVGFLFLRPDFRGGSSGLDFPSFAGYLGGRINIGARSRLLFEVPMANVTGSGVSDLAIGNPFVGVELGPPGGSLLWQVGIRPPLTPDNNSAPLLGFLSDITQLEAFAVDVATVAVQVFYQRRSEDGFTFEAGGGPSFLVATQGGTDSEVFLHYGFRAGYEGGKVRAMAGFDGMMIVTESLGVAERILDQFVATARWGTKIQPIAWVSLPLDDGYNQSVGVVFGLGVEFPVGAAP